MKQSWIFLLLLASFPLSRILTIFIQQIYTHVHQLQHQRNRSIIYWLSISPINCVPYWFPYLLLFLHKLPCLKRILKILHNRSRYPRTDPNTQQRQLLLSLLDRSGSWFHNSIHNSNNQEDNPSSGSYHPNNISLHICQFLCSQKGINKNLQKKSQRSIENPNISLIIQFRCPIVSKNNKCSHNKIRYKSNKSLNNIPQFIPKIIFKVNIRTYTNKVSQQYSICNINSDRILRICSKVDYKLHNKLPQKQ